MNKFTEATNELIENMLKSIEIRKEIRTLLAVTEKEFIELEEKAVRQIKEWYNEEV